MYNVHVCSVCECTVYNEKIYNIQLVVHGVMGKLLPAMTLYHKFLKLPAMVQIYMTVAIVGMHGTF